MQVVERKPVDEDGGDNRSQTPEPSAARRLTLPRRPAGPVHRSRNPRHGDDPPADPDRDVSHNPMVAAACRLTHRQSLRRRSRRPALGQTYPRLTEGSTNYPSWSQQQKTPASGALLERMMGLEPTTFCMASRRSSQLSY